MQLVLVQILQRILILRFRGAAADADGRWILHIDADAGDLRQFRAQFRDDFIGTLPAFVARLQGHEHPAGVHAAAGAPRADGGHETRDIGVLCHDIRRLFLQRRHSRERRTGRGFSKGHDLAGVLTRQEVLPRRHEQEARRNDAGHKGKADHAPVHQAPMQGAFVEGLQPFKGLLAPPVKTALARAMRHVEHAAAHQRCQGHRNDARSNDCKHDGDRKFVQQTADNAAHEHDRYEHSGKRYRHRKNGEADLAGAGECRLHRALAVLHVAHDVFEHDDGVVDDESNRERQRHQ